ncbi:DUF72 domain-containing protein [Desertivirga xinjiangensis]|uniref:DUF72 domain-containing protein n=1 Tax=Desertivirga xinjiangensis TaxID=539206 RepID=UPI00210F15B9|nr:DUF72 domain-containing protein [Pedobacter xinjiangensis]
MKEGLFYSGASGLVLPVPNKLAYPKEFQDKSRLCFYSSIFNSIEVNSSFYKIPQAKTMQRWANETTENFRFTFKLFQDISHAKELQYKPDHIQRFIDIINEVGEKKGCLLVQFPPKFASDNIRELEKLFNELISANNGSWNIAVEFRNKSWYNDHTYDLLNLYNIGIVIHDMPSSATPLMEQSTDFVYLRFHGPQGGYRGSYQDDFLSEYSYYIRDWMEEGKTVYVYFNNTMGDAMNNLVTLNDYVLA